MPCAQSAAVEQPKIKQACMRENTIHYHDIYMISVLEACMLTASVSNLLHEYCASFAFIMFISESQPILEKKLMEIDEN